MPLGDDVSPDKAVAPKKDAFRAPEPPSSVQSEVNVDTRDALGVIFLGICLLFILSAFLRATRRERKLIQQMSDLRVELTKLQKP